MLERRIAIEGDKTQQVELGSRLGMVWLDKLKQPERAITAFEGVLEREGAHAGAIIALERIVEQHEELGPRVRPILEVVYERTARYDKLLKLLEKRLSGEKNEQETRRLRLRIAEISAGELGDAAGAYGALEAAFFEQPSDRDLWDKLADAAEAAGQQRALGGAYSTVIEAGDVGEEARLELAVRAAKLFDEVLGLPEDAEPLHKRVLLADAQTSARSSRSKSSTPALSAGTISSCCTASGSRRRSTPRPARAALAAVLPFEEISTGQSARSRRTSKSSSSIRRTRWRAARSSGCTSGCSVTAILRSC